MARKMTVADTIATKVESLKLRRKPTDIFLNAELILRAMKESEDGASKNEKGEFTITFANENSDTLDFTLAISEEGTMMGAVSKFSNVYVRMTGVPVEYREILVIDTIPSINTPKAKVAEATEKSTVKQHEAKKEQHQSKEDILQGMSDEEIAELLAARRGNAQNKPEEKDANDSNETDSDSEPEAEEQIEANGNEAEDEEQNDADDSATDSDSETEYEESDDDDDGDDEELYKHKRKF